MSTYTSLYYHIVFSTKNRIPCIDKSMRTDLHKYLAGTANGLGANAIEVGGVNDHVHMLVGLKPTHCLANFIRDLKSSATAWIRQKYSKPDFTWQEGYGAFTVSASNREQVKDYILRQEEHHLKLTYKEELLRFLINAKISYDPKYLG